MKSNDSYIKLLFGACLFLLLFATSCNNKNKIMPLTSAGIDSMKVDANNMDNIAMLEKQFLQNLLDTLPRQDWAGNTGYQDELITQVDSFYKMRDYRTAWTEYDGPGEAYDGLIELLESAHEEGLLVEEYQTEKAKQWAENLYEGENKNFIDILRYDIFLSTIAMRYASDLHYGKIRPEKIDQTWEVDRKQVNLAKQLNDAVGGNSLSDIREANRPPFFAYEKMRDALKQYENIKAEGGWDRITGVEVLEVGDTNQAVVQVKKRLSITDDYDIDGQDSTEMVTFGEDLKEAIENFQIRQGIEVDGLVGGTTLARMNEPVDELIRRIRLNMERLRWQPSFDEKNSYIIVNLPEYKLRYYENHDVALEMNVVIGDREHTTPLIIDSLEYIAFSPTWSVPESIAGAEFLPILRKNPGYLHAKGYKLYESWQEGAAELDPNDIDWDDVDPENFPYFIEQQPGVGNALGKVKFMMPNNKAIYLHDTPADHLFSEPQRSFSHGCIRLEKPAELAVTLLSKKDASWDMYKVEEYMNMPEPENVILNEKVPVYFMYLTAFVDNDGVLNFRDDVYGMDDVQQRYLAQK